MKIRRNILTISIYLQPYVTNQLIIKLDKFDCQFDDYLIEKWSLNISNYLMDDPSIFKLHLTTENAWNTLFFFYFSKYNIQYYVVSVIVNIVKPVISIRPLKPLVCLLKYNIYNPYFVLNLHFISSTILIK
jgi:hypothetical protein